MVKYNIVPVYNLVDLVSDNNRHHFVDENGFVLCRFNGHTDAVVRVSVPNGCRCYPDDREQDLCPRHLNRLFGVEFEVMHTYLMDHSRDEEFLEWLGVK